jgi:hypothetical protein
MVDRDWWILPPCSISPAAGRARWRLNLFLVRLDECHCNATLNGPCNSMGRIGIAPSEPLCMIGAAGVNSSVSLSVH